MIRPCPGSLGIKALVFWERPVRRCLGVAGGRPLLIRRPKPGTAANQGPTRFDGASSVLTSLLPDYHSVVPHPPEELRKVLPTINAPPILPERAAMHPWGFPLRPGPGSLKA